MNFFFQRSESMVVFLGHPPEFFIAYIYYIITIFFSDFLTVFLLIVIDNLFFEPFIFLFVMHYSLSFLVGNCPLDCGYNFVKAGTFFLQIIVMTFQSNCLIKCWLIRNLHNLFQTDFQFTVE